SRGSWRSSPSFFFSRRRRHTRWPRDWSSDVCSSDLMLTGGAIVKSTTSSPATGQLTATTTTTGTSLPSGYQVTVDETTSQSIGINSSVTFTGLTATGHTVALSGVPTNCSVNGGTSQTVTVPAGGT